MDMGMKQEILSPGMQHSQEANFCAQAFGVSCDGFQGLRNRLKQQVKYYSFIIESDFIELMWDRENQMKILYGKKFVLSFE